MRASDVCNEFWQLIQEYRYVKDHVVPLHVYPTDPSSGHVAAVCSEIISLEPPTVLHQMEVYGVDDTPRSEVLVTRAQP